MKQCLTVKYYKKYNYFENCICEEYESEVQDVKFQQFVNIIKSHYTSANWQKLMKLYETPSTADIIPAPRHKKAIVIECFPYLVVLFRLCKYFDNDNSSKSASCYHSKLNISAIDIDISNIPEENEYI